MLAGSVLLLLFLLPLMRSVVMLMVVCSGNSIADCASKIGMDVRCILPGGLSERGRGLSENIFWLRQTDSGT